MSFLKNLLEQIKAVSELENKEDRDVVLDTVDMIMYVGKVDHYSKLYREIYEALDEELRVHIENEGIQNIKTEINLKRYKHEVRRMAMNLNLAWEKTSEIIGETYRLTYAYELRNGVKKINNMIVYFI